MRILLVLLLAGTLFAAAPAVTAFAAAKTHRITIEYVVPDDPDLVPIYKQLKEHRTLEKLQHFLKPFLLPKTVKMRLAGCDGESDAFYGNDVITICYEYGADRWEDMPNKKTEGGIAPIDTFVGPFFDTALHEFSHALFDTLKVPVFGAEETAADQLAAFLILQLGRTEAHRLIAGTAYSFMADAKDDDGPASIAEFADTHGTAAQRAYNVLCIGYGADAKLFADAVTRGFLPKERAARCSEEYEQVQDAYEQLIDPHVDQDLASSILDHSWLRKKTK